MDPYPLAGWLRGTGPGQWSPALLLCAGVNPAACSSSLVLVSHYVGMVLNAGRGQRDTTQGQSARVWEPGQRARWERRPLKLLKLEGERWVI